MATPNLGLTTFNTASGSATTFLQFRLAIADASSNMSKIDDFAGGVSASIVNMEAGIIKNVVGNLASPNYFVGTSDITSYDVGSFINLILDTDVGGDTQININSIGNTYLKKIDTSGSVVALASGDVTKNSYYLFTYDGTQYILLSGGAGGGGISSISGSSVMSDTAGSVVKHNISGVTSGSYDRVSVDTYGHVTSASVVSYSSIWSAQAKPTSPHALDDEFDDSSLGASWLLFTPGSSLLVTEDASGLVLYSGSVLDVISGVYKAAASSEFTAWTRISVDTNATDDYKSGLILGADMAGSPSTGSLIVVSLSGEFLSMNTQVELWTNYQTYGAGIANDGINSVPISGPSAYLRVRVSGPMLYVDLSNDGVGWFKYVSGYDMNFIPQHVGLFNRPNGSDENKTRFEFFRYVPSTSAIGQLMHGNRIKVFNR